MVEFYKAGKVEAALVDTANSVDYYDEAWIGLKKVLNWTWVDGEPLLLENWGQGGSAEGDCALMMQSGTWRAANCSQMKPVMCQTGE